MSQMTSSHNPARPNSSNKRQLELGQERPGHPHNLKKRQVGKESPETLRSETSTSREPSTDQETASCVPTTDLQASSSSRIEDASSEDILGLRGADAFRLGDVICYGMVCWYRKIPSIC